MMKQLVMVGAVTAALVLGGTSAHAGPVVVDFASAMDATGLDPDEDDGNGSNAQGPNGLLDSAEMALVAAILANASLDLSGSGGVTHTAVHNAYTQALASATTDLTGVLGIYPQIPTVATGYALSGTVSFAAINAFTTGYGFPLNGNYAQALALDSFLGPNGDADGDGFSNADEYDEYFPGGGTSGYVAAALDPNVGLELSVTVSGEGSYLQNSEVNLVANVSNTLGDETFQWQADLGSGFNNVTNGGAISGATSDTLTIDPVDFSDAGDYRVVVTNSQTNATSDAVEMNVVASLPALNVVGLGVALMTLVLVAGVMLRRRSA